MHIVYITHEEQYSMNMRGRMIHCGRTNKHPDTLFGIRTQSFDQRTRALSVFAGPVLVGSARGDELIRVQVLSDVQWCGVKRDVIQTLRNSL